MFCIIFRPIHHVSQPLKGLVQVNVFLQGPLELSCQVMACGSFPVCWCLGILCKMFQTSSALLLEEALFPSVHSQSSGLLFTKEPLTFPSKSSYHTQVLVPLAAQINLPLILGNSNKIFPQCSVLNRSQPNLFICFISLCLQKDCISNKGFYNPFSSNISPLFLLH